MSLPSGSTGVLNAIGGSGPHDLWAVGFTPNADATVEQVLFEHFDGHAWQQVPFPAQTAACDPNAADCFINPKAVSAAAPDDVTGAAGLGGGLVFAVGARDIPGQCCLRTLGLRTAAG